MMGGTCFTSFYSSFIQDLHSTGSPGVPLLKAEYTKKRKKERRSGVYNLMFYLIIETKDYVTVTLGWHDSRSM